jgi:hypothetical protein
MSAVTFEVPPGAIDEGTAPVFSMIQGLKSTTVLVTVPQPVLPGPALQPHQLFSTLLMVGGAFGCRLRLPTGFAPTSSSMTETGRALPFFGILLFDSTDSGEPVCAIAMAVVFEIMRLKCASKAAQTNRH